MSETQTNAGPFADLQSTLDEWAENPPANLSGGLAERGITVEALEEYSRSGLTPEQTETLRRVLVQGAATGDAADAALLARLTPLLDPRERAWERMMRAQSTRETVTATVTEAVKGGLVVDLGVRGFVPASQVGLKPDRNLTRYVGQTLRLRVLEVDRKKQTVILSNRVILEEERAESRKQAISRINEGDEITGKIKRLTDIGAFVDVGGVDGLLHVSEISWKRIDKPSDVLSVGQKIRVKVLRVDPGAGRISLSARKLLPDPWEAARKDFAPGTVVTVTIASTVAQGAVVQLNEDLEGFIPISELAQRRISTPEEAVKVGDEVQALVTELNARERRIVLSIRKLEQRKERQVIESYQQRARSTSDRTTLGDLFGHLFQELQQQEEAQEEAAEESAPATSEAEAEAPAEETATPAETEEAASEASAEETLEPAEAEEAVAEAPAGEAAEATEEPAAEGAAPAGDGEASAETAGAETRAEADGE